MNSFELSVKMRQKSLTVLEGDVPQRVCACLEAVRMCIPPQTRSDRTCLSNVGKWLCNACETGVLNPDEVLPRVIDFALEASNPEARNPAAVFMSILKKELRYAA